MSSIEHVTKLFKEAIEQTFPNISHQPIISKANPKFGDYQCNSAMPLFKQYGVQLGFKNPKQIGERLYESIKEDTTLESVTVAPAGFVTIKLKNSWLTSQVRQVITGGGVTYTADTKLRVVVDFSSPNIAKQMHVGHLRSTIIGDSICRVLEFAGHEVHRINHVGDWGTQFGMLIEHLRESNFDSNLNYNNNNNNNNNDNNNDTHTGDNREEDAQMTDKQTTPVSLDIHMNDVNNTHTHTHTNTDIIQTYRILYNYIPPKLSELCARDVSTDFIQLAVSLLCCLPSSAAGLVDTWLKLPITSQQDTHTHTQSQTLTQTQSQIQIDSQTHTHTHTHTHTRM
eukprot:GHVR01018596.1.p1 GENE.GHVR01018596.1~~GHVR01018596.1.p1  ORF type:complete len:353 (+),score=150.94 GHVR01018596.1:41-1060(+)